MEWSQQDGHLQESLTCMHTGCDGVVRVVTVEIRDGTYTRSVTNVAVLIPCE